MPRDTTTAPSTTTNTTIAVRKGRRVSPPAMCKFDPKPIPIKVVAISTMNRIFSITGIFKLHKSEARWPRGDLQVNFNYPSILVEQILHLPLPDIPGEVPNINGPAPAPTHPSLLRPEERGTAEGWVCAQAVASPVTKGNRRRR